MTIIEEKGDDGIIIHEHICTVIIRGIIYTLI